MYLSFCRKILDTVLSNVSPHRHQHYFHKVYLRSTLNLAPIWVCFMVGLFSASRHINLRSSSVSFLRDVVVFALVGVRSDPMLLADKGV